MKGEIYSPLHIRVYAELPMPDNGLIVTADPVEKEWHDLYQVRHEEGGFMN